jgi:hypothetical protein
MSAAPGPTPRPILSAGPRPTRLAHPDRSEEL